jgi:hypothetical protein
MVDSVSALLIVKEHHLPNILPRTNKWECPNVVVEHLRMVHGNPKKTLE